MTIRSEKKWSVVTKPEITEMLKLKLGNTTFKAMIIKTFRLKGKYCHKKKPNRWRILVEEYKPLKTTNRNS